MLEMLNTVCYMEYSSLILYLLILMSFKMVKKELVFIR